MTNSPSHQPESEPNNKNGDSQLSSPGTHNHTTSNGHTQHTHWKTLIEEKKRQAEREAAEKGNPAGQPVATNRRGSRPSEQHSSRTLEGETLNGVTHPESYADAIPDVNTEKPESVRLSDSIVENVIGHADPLIVFPRWGKGDTPRDTSSDEVQFRCPTPGHTDTNPSASLNTKTGLWVCFGCEAGGDIYTLGGIKFGMDEHSSDLPALKRKMAEDLTGKSFIEHGPYSVIDIPAVRELVDAENRERERREEEDNRALQEKLQAKEQQAQALEQEYQAEMDEFTRMLEDSELVDEPAPRTPGTPTDSAATTAPTVDAPATLDLPANPNPQPAKDQPAESSQTPNYDHLMVPPPQFTGYDGLLAPGTFLADYYAATSQDKYANDFHFFNGLVGLSLAIGRKATLRDEQPIIGNLYVCFVANTGAGKSKTGSWLSRVVNSGIPFVPSDPDRLGVKLLNDPGSGEYLLDQMVDEVVPTPGVPASPTAPSTDTGRVKALLAYDELSKLAAKSGREGNTLLTMVTELYDTRRAATGSRSSKPVVAIDPYLVVTANVQPSALRKMFNKDNISSGFLNRWLFVDLNTRKKHNFIGKPVNVDTEYLGGRLREIALWANNDSDGRSLDYTAEAVELLERFFDMELARYSGVMNADAESMYVRLDLVVKKFCLLLAANEMSDTVTAPIAVKAIKLYWITKPGMEEASGTIGKSDVSGLEDSILQKVTAYFERHVEPITSNRILGGGCQVQRDILNKGGFSKQDYERSLATLVKVGLLQEVKTGRAVKYRPADDD